tara:strand:+ start:362 stop:604 length:243 start_codon:yes stop_codon:yes gene_type:complete
MRSQGSSEQVVGHSAGVCRVLPLGSIAGNGDTLGKYDNDANNSASCSTVGALLQWKLVPEEDQAIPSRVRWYKYGKKSSF